MRSIIVIAVLATAFVTSTANAGPEGVRFRVSGYELETPAGRAAVMKRMEKIVARACDTGKSVTVIRMEEACEQQLSQELVSNIGNDDLTKDFNRQ